MLANFHLPHTSGAVLPVLVLVVVCVGGRRWRWPRSRGSLGYLEANGKQDGADARQKRRQGRVATLCGLACSQQDSCLRPQSNMGNFRGLRSSTDTPGWSVDLLLIERVEARDPRLERLQSATPNVSGLFISVFCSCFHNIRLSIKRGPRPRRSGVCLCKSLLNACHKNIGI